MIRYYIPLGIALLLVASFCNAQGACDEESHEMRFSMNVLKASDIALNQFKRDQPKADQEHFHVSVEEFDTYFEINFLVDTGPIEQGVEGGTAYIMIPNPHGNQYGRNVGYEVSKESGKILKTFYSK